jgi:DNA-binding response OmpR family regulator
MSAASPQPAAIVLDASPSSRAWVRECLAPLALDVIDAPTLAGAVAALATRPGPALVMIDIASTDVALADAVARLRDAHTTGGLALLLLGAEDEADALAAALAENSGTDYLIRPFTPGLVCARVRAALDHTRLRTTHEALADEVAALRDRAGRLSSSTLAMSSRDAAPGDAGAPGSATITEVRLAEDARFWARASAETLYSVVGRLFDAFDEACARHGALRLRTMGGVYRAITGHDGAGSHADAGIALARDILKAHAALTASVDAPAVRVGVSSGAIVLASMTGGLDAWGPAVLAAESLARTAAPATGQTDHHTAERLASRQGLRERGPYYIDGAGDVRIFVLEETA